MGRLPSVSVWPKGRDRPRGSDQWPVRPSPANHSASCWGSGRISPASIALFAGLSWMLTSNLSSSSPVASCSIVQSSDKSCFFTSADRPARITPRIIAHGRGFAAREDIGGLHLVKQNPHEAPRSTRELRVNPSNLFGDICFLRSRKRILECKAGIEWHHALPFDVDLVPVTLVLRCFRDVRGYRSPF